MHQVNTMENLSSLLAEQSVIGGMLLNGESDNAIYALEILTTQDFYYRDTRLAWEFICQVAAKNNPIDLLTVAEEAEKSHSDLTISTLGAMMKDTPSQANLQRYAEIVKNNSKMRAAYHACLTAAEALINPGDPEQRLAKALDAVSNIGIDTAKDDEPKDARQVLQEVLDDMEDALRNGGAMSGISTGFENIDAMTCGMQEADLIIIAARPSMGKTTLAMNIAENVAYVNEKKGNVLVFSLEMPRKALMKKTICRFGSLFMQKINTGQALDNDHDSARLDQAMQQVVNTTGKFIIDDKGGQHISQIRARAKRAKMKNGKIDLIVVDYLQLIQAEGNSKNDIVSNVSAGLKNLAKEMRCPVIALSQLNRALVGRPEMKNLRDSGAIEQDADVIIFLHDEDYEKNRGDHSLTEIIFGKQRVGPTGTTYLQPELAFSRFADTKRLPAAPTEEQPSGRKYAKREFN